MKCPEKALDLVFWQHDEDDSSKNGGDKYMIFMMKT